MTASATCRAHRLLKVLDVVSSRFMCLPYGAEALKGAKEEEARISQMSEQAPKVKNKAIPQWAQGLYYNKGFFSEALVYHDGEALFFEIRGKDSGVLRFSFEMLETLKTVIEEEQEKEEQGTSEDGRSPQWQA
jgi:hypothetical protein